MAAIALLKFIQGTRQPTAGRALIVLPSVITYIENGGDNSSVKSWRIELLDHPTGQGTATPGAPQLLAENANGNTPDANITPGPATSPGCYRIRLRVWTEIDFGGTLDTDIRNICVLSPNRYIILPPYQKLPDPLPLPGEGKPGEKPDELNFEGQPWGWSGPTDYGAGGYGSEYDYFRLLNASLYWLDIFTSGTSLVPDGSALGQFLYWTGSAWDYTDQTYTSGSLSNHVASPIFDIYRGETKLVGPEYQSVVGYSVLQTLREWQTDHYEPRTFWRSLALKTIEAGSVGQVIAMQYDSQDAAIRARWSRSGTPPAPGSEQVTALVWDASAQEAYWYAFSRLPSGSASGAGLWWNSVDGQWQASGGPTSVGEVFTSAYNGTLSYYYALWATVPVVPAGTSSQVGEMLYWDNTAWVVSAVPPNTGGYIPYIWNGAALSWLPLTAGTTDELVKVSADDTDARHLEDKVTPGTGIAIATVNPGGDEDLQITNTAPMTAHALGGSDHTADTLANLNLKVTDANLVPEARTLSAVQPMRIAGGDSADLSADRSITVSPVSTSFAGVVPALGGNGYAWLLTGSSGTSASWQTPPVWMPARKSTAGSLAKGKAVYVTGYDVTNSCALIEYADCDDPAKMPAVGLTMEVISDTVTGRVAVCGTVSNVDASFGATWSEGDVLYVDSGGLGQMTNTRPASTSAIIQRMGEVIRANPTIGIIELAGMTTPAELPQFSAAGSIWYGGASGTPTELPQGSAGTFLQTGSPPAWVTPPDVTTTAPGYAPTASVDNAVLRRSGSSVGWALIANTNVATGAAIAVTKLAAGTDQQLLGNSGGTNTWMTPVTIGIPQYTGSAVQGDILYYNGTSWARLGYGTSGQVLQTNGSGANPSWVTPSSGTGDVVGPASSQDNVICRFSGTTGKLIQGGGADGVSDNPPTYDDSGNFYMNANGSSTASPRIFGAANFSDPGTPEAVRWEFGDSANSISNVYGGAMTIRSYHTLILRGNNSNLDTSWSTESNIGVWIDNTAAANPALVVEGATSQSAALQIWRNSAGTMLSQVTASGDHDLNDNDLFRVKLATFSDFHNAGSVGGGGEIDIDPINGNKQYCTFSGTTGTLNFDPLPTAGETASLIVMVISTTSTLTSLSLEANEGADTVYGGDGDIKIEGLGTTILGVFYDGTGDVYVTSSPTQQSVTSATIV
jgi:hypothetical protein